MRTAYTVGSIPATHPQIPHHKSTDSTATLEQVCMLGLYALGATMLNSLSQNTAPPSSHPPKMHLSIPAFPEPVPSPAPSAGRLQVPGATQTKKNRLRRSIEEHSIRPSHQYPQTQLKPPSSRGGRDGRSFEFLSSARNAPMPPPRTNPMALINEFSFNASKLGIVGSTLEADLPPASPLSTQTDLSLTSTPHHLTVLQEEKKGEYWSRKMPSFSMASNRGRDKRAGSVPETAGVSSPYISAHHGQMPFASHPQQNTLFLEPRHIPSSEAGGRSRSMSLDVARVARKSFNAMRPKRSSPVSPQAPPLMRTHSSTAYSAAAPPQLDGFSFSYRGQQWITSPTSPGLMMMCDLPRESQSSSDSDYDSDGEYDYGYDYGHGLDRRHNVSGSSGHGEAPHARMRGNSGGFYASTAPSTVVYGCPVVPASALSSAFSMPSAKDHHDEEEEDSSDDEDDIDWEQSQAIRRPCPSPTSLDYAHQDAKPAVPMMHSYAPTFVSMSSHFSPSKLLQRGPRRVASASSLGARSSVLNESSFGERARRSFSQARSLLTVPSSPLKRNGRPSTSDGERPTAALLHPISTFGLMISRPCQTTPNQMSAMSGSTRSDSFSGSTTTNTNETGSIRYPSLYLATSSENDTGSSGASSTGRSVDSVISPELAALEELILTECKFLNDLQLLNHVYVVGLRKLDLITLASLDKIVSNLDEVMAFSKFLIDCVRAFLPRRPSPATWVTSNPSQPDSSSWQQQHRHSKQKSVEEANAPDYLSLGNKLVRELPARMEVFARYCMNYGEAKERLEFERDLRPAVATFIELARSTNPALQGMDMQQFLVLPVQRVTRYPLLFGCLAKHFDKRQESNEIREEDEDQVLDQEAGDALQQRQERNKVIHSNWLRLRDASASICEITNLAISYQQKPRPESARPRATAACRPSMSSPSLPYSGWGRLLMAPGLAMMEEREDSRVLASAPTPASARAVVQPKPQPRTPSFSLASMTKRRQTPAASSAGGDDSSASETTSSNSSRTSSLLGKLLKPFRHPTA
ncbi:related to Intersectin 1 [Ustilago bromivora]|uniref:Related to Intersectin 1 n=2 Tax=Ustilago bromivora TaxID=307758 RepID=A0A1K0HAV0_9BASI|nr:related to Intersectin 1 [Ustilago bromivora]